MTDITAEQARAVCDNCAFAEWKRTSTGRLHPSREGKCTAPIAEIVLPAAFYWVGGTPRPFGGYITRKTELRDPCPRYVPVGGKEVATHD